MAMADNEALAYGDELADTGLDEKRDPDAILSPDQLAAALDRAYQVFRRSYVGYSSFDRAYRYADGQKMERTPPFPLLEHSASFDGRTSDRCVTDLREIYETSPDQVKLILVPMLHYHHAKMSEAAAEIGRLTSFLVGSEPQAAAGAAPPGIPPHVGSIAPARRPVREARR